jgi:opacity protein-like surface antigen
MKKTLLAAAVVFAASASVAQAQALKPFTFGASAGASIPTGKMGDGSSTGFNVAGLAEYRAPSLPVTLRGELAYNRFGIKDLPADVNGHNSILGASVSAVAPFATSPSLRPYAIGGVGVYQVKTSMSSGGVDFSASKTAPGLNGGLGFQFHLAGMSTFAEARYQYIFSKDENKSFENASQIPVTIGFRF